MGALIGRFLDWLANLGMKDKHIVLRSQPDGTWKPEVISTRQLEWLEKTGDVQIAKSPEEVRQMTRR